MRAQAGGARIHQACNHDEIHTRFAPSIIGGPVRAGAGLDASAWFALCSSGSDRSEITTIVIRSRWKQQPEPEPEPKLSRRARGAKEEQDRNHDM